MSIQDIRDLVLKLKPELAEQEKPLVIITTHFCTGCLQTKDIMEFVPKRSRTGKARIPCNDCRNSWYKLRIKIKELFPPTTHCECCGELFDELNPACCDHKHGETDPVKAFRGWLCRSCNGGIGFLSNPENLQKALKYLEERGI